MTLGLKVHEEFEECEVQEVLEERNITAHFEDSAALVLQSHECKKLIDSHRDYYEW
jgi:hypothetical protein